MPATFTVTGTIPDDTSSNRSVYVRYTTNVTNPTEDLSYGTPQRVAATNGTFTIDGLAAWDPLNLPYDDAAPQHGFIISTGGKFRWTIPAQAADAEVDVADFAEPWAVPVSNSQYADIMNAASSVAAGVALVENAVDADDSLMTTVAEDAGSDFRGALNAAIGATKINLTDRAATLDSAGLQAVIDAAPSGAEFYLARQGGGDGSITLGNAPLVPSGPGQKFVHERGLILKQPNLYKPVYDVLDVEDVTVHDLVAEGPATRPASGVAFRGSSTANYQAAVWSNSHRTRVTGKTVITNFKIGVNFTAWDTGAGAFVTNAHKDNYLEDLLAVGSDFGVLYYGQDGLYLGHVTTRDHIDSSAGGDPNHCIYGSGSPSIRSKNVQIGSALCDGNEFGSAFSLKYTDGLQFAQGIAENCGRLIALIDVTDWDIGMLMLHGTVVDIEAAAMVTGSTPLPTRGHIGTILINDTGDTLTANVTNAVNFAGDTVNIDEIQVVTHLATPTARADVIIAGDKVKAKSVKTIAAGAASASLQIGKSTLAATDCTVTGHESWGASAVLNVNKGSTGIVYDHDSARHRAGSYSGTGIAIIGSGADPTYTVRFAGGAGGGGATPFPLTTGESNMDRGNTTLSDMGAPASGQLCLRYFTATKTESISSVKMITGSTAAAATPTLCKMGIYSVDPSTGALTLVASTASDTTLFAAANTSYTKALQSAFTKTAGQLYATASLVVSGAAVPSFIGQQQLAASTVDVLLSEAPRVTARLDSQTDLPSSVSAGSLSGTTRKQAYCELIP